MTKQTFTRVTCEGCGEQEEVEGGILSRYPASWKKVEGYWFCTDCYSKYKAAFNNLLAQLRAKK